VVGQEWKYQRKSIEGATRQSVSQFRQHVTEARGVLPGQIHDLDWPYATPGE
jgi:hypothetical protein